jgi:hypothetical protein
MPLRTSHRVEERVENSESVSPAAAAYFEPSALPDDPPRPVSPRHSAGTWPRPLVAPPPEPLIKDEPDAIRAVLAEAASSGARAVLFRADRQCGDDVPCYGRHLPGHDPLRDARLTQAVKLALEALILPELGHAIRELTR